MKILAHSAAYCGKEQTYEAHTEGVTKLLKNMLENIQPYVSIKLYTRLERALLAGEFHDMGKLDEKNQKNLHDNTRKSSLPIPHQIAGAKYLYKAYNDIFAAALIFGHHMPGLPDLNGDAKELFCYYPRNRIMNQEELIKYIETHLQNYLEVHRQIRGEIGLNVQRDVPTAMEMRMMLSCLVDADWSDTAGEEKKDISPRWEERLASLDLFIQNKEAICTGEERKKERNRKRHEMYYACREKTNIDNSMFNGDAAVGTGKTTAFLAHLLRCAKRENLRHIFVVLPYTNILEQTEKVLKETVVLPGETPEEIIAVIHHRAEYSSSEMKKLADIWDTPFILTTAVQFFETLASNEPGRLRKLHQLPGSGIFLDEFHASVPVACIPIVWQWLTELSNVWGCKVLLSSGTMIRFWDNTNIRNIYKGSRAGSYHIQSPEELLPDSLRKSLVEQEKSRIHLGLSKDEFMQNHFYKVDDLLEFVLSKRGPRILMMDTRKASALVAYRLKKKGKKVYHLSNVFKPEDSAGILQKVEEMLQETYKDPLKEDWTLVCTTYAGMGLNLSFRNGFCRTFSCTVFLQLAGRINRNGDFDDAGLWAFTLDDAKVPENKGMRLSREVWTEMIQEGIDGDSLTECSPSQLATYAFREECKRSFGTASKQSQLLSAERSFQFADLAKNFKIIPEEQEILAITDLNILDNTLSGNKRAVKEILQKKGVSIYKSVADELQLETVGNFPELRYLPPEKYDSELLGYLKVWVTENG